MKQVILINLLLWAFLFPVFSQGGYHPPRAERGYVYLKDGTVLKGKYLYSPDLDKVKVTANGESRIYNADEIEKVSNKGPEIGKNNEFVYKQRKFTSITEGGILLGNPNNDRKAPFTLSTSLNYTLTDGLSVGLGTGVEFYHETYLPVTANIHYRFGTNQISPFATIQVGYLIGLENYYRPNYMYAYDMGPSSRNSYPYLRYQELDAEGGLMINPAVGAIIETNYGFGISLSVGYRYHRLKYTTDRDDYNLNIDYNRLSLKLGIIF